MLPLLHASPLGPRPFAVTTATPARRSAEQHARSRALLRRLGFARYWLAEHHNLPTIASSAPDIMIGQVAA
jgi:alkanesulfonate monooxygenase SsuD/methylene tetrahydromethanopterin reductase-like flavin-dependent oxidoreductase (luciferase family)